MYDMIVIGGGINGAAVAREASLRNLNVLLLEKNDWAFGASSKTSKLAHGGLRYLEQLEFSLVKESVRERNWLVNHAKPFVKPLPFIFPIYQESQRPAWQVQIGLLIYDFFTVFKSLGRHQSLKKDKILEMVPRLKKEGLKSGFLYYDAQMKDQRIVIEHVLSAKEAGADVYNYSPVTDLIKENGRIYGVKYRKGGAGKTIEARARCVVNTTGAWSNEIFAKDEIKPRYQVNPSKGVHIVLPNIGLKHALILETPQDKRIFFILPWMHKTLVGTTDTFFDGNPDCLKAEEQDVEYLLTAYNHYFKDEQLQACDIISTFVGLRPLVKSQHSEASKASRDYVINESSSGLMTLIGGKYTTHAVMATELVDKVYRKWQKECRFGNKKQALTNVTPEQEALLRDQYKKFNLSAAQIEHLWCNYGVRGTAIFDILKGWPEGCSPLETGLPYIMAEIKYVIEHEMVLHLSDWYERRSYMAYSSSRGVVSLAVVANYFAALLGWTKEQKELEIKTYEESLPNF